jgi:NAD(P)-dependent dehydrogenase (short-subunit alcohol dehydrogenase family)
VGEQLEGRVGIITGGAGGIGRAGALLFAREGASVVVFDVDEAGGSRAVDEVLTAGGVAMFVRGDCANEDDVAGVVDVTVQRFGGLDLLWSNVGIGVSKSVPDTTLEEWNRVLAVNLTGAFLLAKYGIPRLVQAGGGTMVISGSANSFVADREWAAYCTTKGGLLMLTKALALDHALDGVRVNIVCPGSVTTPLHDAWLLGKDRPYEEIREEDRMAHPMHRFATPDEVAKAALFLSSDASSFTTGSALFVDGGLTAL